MARSGHNAPNESGESESRALIARKQSPEEVAHSFQLTLSCYLPPRWNVVDQL
jgi:hypothetical protein